MDKKDIKIMIKKDIVLNKDISNHAFITYLGIAICLKQGIDLIYTDKDMIYYYLTGQVNAVPRNFNELLRSGLKELIENNIISCKKKKSSSYYFDASDFIINENDNYVVVYLSEIKKIICNNYKGKINLLRFYLCLLSTFILNNHIQDIRDSNKYNNVLGMLSQEYLSSITDISVRTAMEYIKLLEELNLIYVSRCSFMFKDKKGNVKRHNNIYGRYDDKDIIEEFTKVRYEMYDDLHKIHMSSASNNSRSLMQKYNQMVKGKVYNNEVVDNVYNYLIQYNKKHPNNCKNMDIFMKYGYNVDLD